MSNAEADRLRALRELGVLDTLPEEGFDRLTALAAALFDAPMATVSLIDEDRQWFKSRVGIDATETAREVAFCHHAIQGAPNSAMVVEDATQDERFAANPLVTSDPNIRFYAGATLTSSSGHNLGTLCVIDDTPRETPSAKDIDRLKVLARMVVDQLELRKARRLVEENRRLLQLAEVMSGVGHWRYNLTTQTVEWSDEVYHIRGVDRAGFNPNLDAGIAFYHPDDQPVVAALVQRAIKHGEDFSYQSRLLRRDGEIRHVTCKAMCELDAKGAVVAIFGVFQDVTDQVRILAAVEKSEARYRLLTENANDLVTEMDREGRFTYVSPAVKAITGYDLTEVVGRPALTFIHPDDHAPVAKEFGKALKGPSGWRIEYRIVCKDGRIIWVEARPTIMRDPATGEAIGVTDVIRDITDRKALESQLRHAQAEAEAAAAVKGEFLANMSHELRTPLTSILGFSKLLKERCELDAEGARYVQRVSDASAALLTTVNDILDFSKLEAGQVEIEARSVDPAVMAEGALELLAPQAEAKGLTLAFDGEGLPSRVMADDTRIRQILLNLVSNAVKFTETGGVTVRARYDAATERLRCEVIDTGPGVPPDRLGRLFKRFSQVDASTTRSHGGTGLGLAICKGLAEAMGGAVGASSVLGQGSRFWFEIPCRAAAAPAAKSSMVALAASNGLQGLKVMVADDNAVNRELVRIILTPFGVDVTEADGGRRAVELASEHAFDLILMDMRMPEVDGVGATKAIRAGEGPNAAAPIVAFTADAGDFDARAVPMALFAGRISKPIMAADLLTAVETAARGRGAAPKSATPQARAETL